MPKLTLDMSTFKALASDTRLDILRALDGKKLSLNDICKATNLNKATLHEHLTKLNEAGLVKKKEREGHKWVYYKLTWKGEGLLHPENTRIVVMFSTTFISLFLAVMLMVNFLQPIPVGIAETVDDTTYLYEVVNEGNALVRTGYSINYLGEVDAKEKNVGNITTELQSRARIKNGIGDNYDDSDIVWVEPEASMPIVEDDGISFDYYHEYGANEATAPEPSEKLNIDVGFVQMASIQNDQVILYKIPDINFSSCYLDINTSINETKWEAGIGLNETDEPSGDDVSDNDTDNESYLAAGEENRFLDFYPAVPQMIATVQDPTLLYLAVACLTFFGTLFTLSSWRLWINRKPKL